MTIMYLHKFYSICEKNLPKHKNRIKLCKCSPTICLTEYRNASIDKSASSYLPVFATLSAHNLSA